MPELKINKVVIASQQAVFRRGLCSLVIASPEMNLVGEAQNHQDTYQVCRMTEPDLLVLDPGTDPEAWKEIVFKIARQIPSIRILLLSDAGNEDLNPGWIDDPVMTKVSRDVSEEGFIAAALLAIEGPSKPGWVSHFQEPGMDPLSLDAPPKTWPFPISRLDPPAWQRSDELITRELAMAGKIQADILPEEVPQISGWEISAKLEPARETSGDFYDFIPLTDHKWGIAVADVTDKGMGAAIFMALCSSLFRTYASRFPTLPAVTLNAVSTRILADTRGCMFVTMFFGILEPQIDRMVFANAGHPPGYLISTHRRKASYERLQPTGMALGVSGEAQWKQKIIRFNPGDILLLYTDGITEAQAPDGDFFGEDRLVDLAFSLAGCQADVVRDTILKEVHTFVGDAPPQDDIALIVVRRSDGSAAHHNRS